MRIAHPHIPGRPFDLVRPEDSPLSALNRHADADTGRDKLTFELPRGAHVFSRLEANKSTTLTFSFQDGTTFRWNSGTFVTCWVIGGGVGAAVTAYSGGNAQLGSLATFLAARGCTFAIQRLSDTDDTADGDGD